MTRTAYLIVGPESSGNRLWGRLLVAAGCYGDGDCVQRLDSELTSVAELPDKIMLIRSFPHSCYWPNLEKVCGLLKLNGYDKVSILVTYRNPLAVVKSQVAHGHVTDETMAYEHINKAYGLIYSSGITHPMFPLSYELLVTWQLNYLNAILAGIGLDKLMSLPEEIRDENEKYAE